MADLTGERQFTPERQAQGFTSQEDLDAFFAAYDHTRNCPAGVCGTPGPSMWLEGSASWQPTERRCPEGQRLDQVSFSFSRYAQGSRS